MIHQKLFALALIAISIVCMAMGDGTIAIVLIPAGIGLFFSKHNWIDISYEED